MSKNFSFKLEGVEDIKRHLIKAAELKDVQNAVKLNTSEMQQDMKRRAVFKGHWRGNKFIKPTGTTKRSISMEITDSGFTGMVGPKTEYSPYLIYGTRYMAAQDFFRPAFYKQKEQFERDIARLMK